MQRVAKTDKILIPRVYSQSMIPQGNTRELVHDTDCVTKNIDKYISSIIMKKWILCQEFEGHWQHDQRS